MEGSKEHVDVQLNHMDVSSKFSSSLCKWVSGSSSLQGATKYRPPWFGNEETFDLCSSLKDLKRPIDWLML